MPFLAALIAALCFTITVLSSSSTPLTVQTYEGEKTGRHIVKLNPGVDRALFLKAANITATHQYTVFNGFAGHLSNETLNDLCTNINVSSIAEGGFGHLDATQMDAPWGLARLSSTQKLSNKGPYSYEYNQTDGAGVDVYIIDSGVNIDHIDFGGRARWGSVFSGGKKEDIIGHGTHCAGIVAGKTYGVAKEANIIAVKVVSDDGKPTIENVISGLEYTFDSFLQSKQKSVALVPMTFAQNENIDMITNLLREIGVYVVVSAGNDNTDAEEISPARASYAITVGASSVLDVRAPFTNFGKVVDIFAPGVNIISTSIGSNTSIAVKSGTSMAAAHVSGFIAYLLTTTWDTDIQAKMNRIALKNMLSNIPFGTVNALAYNAYAEQGQLMISNTVNKNVIELSSNDNKTIYAQSNIPSFYGLWYTVPYRQSVYIRNYKTGFYLSVDTRTRRAIATKDIKSALIWNLNPLGNDLYEIMNPAYIPQAVGSVLGLIGTELILEQWTPSTPQEYQKWYISPPQL